MALIPYLFIGAGAVAAAVCIAIGALIDHRANAASRWTQW